MTVADERTDEAGISFDFPVISADSHITEPPDCYTANIDPAFRDRAPHMVTDDVRGDLFVIPGMKRPNRDGARGRRRQAGR
jgi:hypothetical protein